MPDIIHQFPIFLFIHNGDDLFANLVVVCANTLVNSGTAAQIMKNESKNLIEFGGNDAYPAFDIHAKNKVVNQDSTEICTQNTENNGFGIIAKGRGQGYQDAAAGQDDLAGA